MKNLIDSEIEKAYYRLADGKVIDIMDIPKVFAFARKALAEGHGNIESAVRAAILMYCEDANKLNHKGS
jgi:hypothetical protein